MTSNRDADLGGDLNIDRCTCFQVHFAELRDVAVRTGAASIEELQRHREFGLQCRLCHPYVRRMLRSGCTAFDHIITEDDEENQPPIHDLPGGL